MHRCVLGKGTLRLFPIGPSNLPVVVIQPDERLAKRTKKVLCVGVVKPGFRRFCGGSQSYSINWLLSSKKCYFSYINWRNDKNRGLRCGDLFFGDQGKNRSPRSEDLFFILEIRTKIALPEAKTFFWRSGKSLGIQSWLESGDLFFRNGGPQSYSRTAVVHRAMGHANFQTIQNGPRFRKVWEPLG